MVNNSKILNLEDLEQEIMKEEILEERVMKKRALEDKEKEIKVRKHEYMNEFFKSLEIQINKKKDIPEFYKLARKVQKVGYFIRDEIKLNPEVKNQYLDKILGAMSILEMMNETKNILFPRLFRLYGFSSIEGGYQIDLTHESHFNIYNENRGPNPNVKVRNLNLHKRTK